MTKTKQVRTRTTPKRKCRIDNVSDYKPVSSPKKDKFIDKVKKMVEVMREENRLLNERMAEELRLFDERIEEEMAQFSAQLESNRHTPNFI